MIQIKAFLLAFVFENFCDAFDFNVGPCGKNILDQRLKGFKIQHIANTGYYDYVFVNANPDLEYGATTIYGDEEMGYKEKVMLDYDTEGVMKYNFILNSLEDGILNETYFGEDNDGQAVVKNYYIVVITYDEYEGVFYYVRCSTDGTSEIDHRFITVRSENSFRGSDGRDLAIKLADKDSLRGFKGESPHLMKTCKLIL